MVILRDEPNILLIVLDTLRKDVMNEYGGRANTPALDALSKESMVYKNPIAQSPWTMPSHASLFTGLNPSEHGVHESSLLDPFDIIQKNIRHGRRMFQEDLRHKGYKTLAISNNVWISTGTGFERGFDDLKFIDTVPGWITDTFNEAQKYGDSIPKVLASLAKSANIKGMAGYANAWLSKKIIDRKQNYPLDKGAKMTADLMSQLDWKSRTFMFINLVEVHEPYVAETEAERWGAFMGIRQVGAKRAAQLKQQYVRELEYVDGQLGRMIADLKRKNAYDNTMIIITSDHGQAFNEHGYMYHGTYTYDELTNVPAIIKYPKGKKYKEIGGYQPLTNFGRFLEEASEGGDDGALTTESAIAESYGFTHVLPPRYKHMKDKISSVLMQERRSLYKDGYKLTLNVSTETVEEFTFNGREADRNRHKASFNELEDELGNI